MAFTLHLGVADIPYAFQAPRRVRTRMRRGGKPVASSAPASGAQTTGDVAEILEARYHPMEVFFETHQQEIADGFADAMAGSLESLLLGAPPSSNIFAAVEGQIEAGFKAFLSNREMDALGVPGVPTAAARKGVNHRLKHPYAKSNPERPSFIDSSLYVNSMKAWIS